MMRPLFSLFTVSLALVLGLLRPSLARPVAHSGAHIQKLKEAILPPANWIDLGPAPPTQLIWLRIALPQARFPELERQLYEISDPKNARYGQHLLKEQVAELVRPDRRSMQAVDAWLDEYGIAGADRVRRSVAGDWVTILLPVATADEMMDTEFHLWKNARDGEDGDVIVRTTRYSLPEHLHRHIELVQPTTYFGRPKPMSTTSFILGLNISISIFPPSPPPPPANFTPGSLTDPYLGTNCSDIITPSCLKELYNALDYEPTQMDKNSIGVTGYLGQFANEEDLQSLYEFLLPEAEDYTFETETVNGGQNNQALQAAGPEANLDTQYAFGLAYPTPGTFYSTGGSPSSFTPDAKTPTNSNEPYDDWLEYMLGLRNGDVPQTISTSYSDDEQTVPNSYAVRVCKEFALLGSRGVSIIFSSGDGGVGDGNPNPATQKCISNDGKNKTKFLPQFPASCPYVTAVGGTQGIPEVAAPFSGGGFSNYFARPSYQQSAVQTYLTTLPIGKYQGLFNPSGRAYPDVSAQANNYAIFFQGQPALIGGTSAAAPTFAGFVALLNDASIAAGKSPLGFLNPMLYSTGLPGLHDITQGNAPGCGTQGFSATTGWDPVTGLGTPNFGVLQSILTTYTPPAPTLLVSLSGILLNLKISLFLSLNLL